MQVSWKLAARSFFDQLSKSQQKSVEQAVERLASDWQPSRLQKVDGLFSEDGQPLLKLKVGQDLRVLLYRRAQTIVVVDVLRHSQIERLRSASGFGA